MAGRPAQRQELDRWRAVQADPPDRWTRVEVGRRGPVGHEDQGPPAGIPAHVPDAPVAPGQATWAGTPAGPHDEEVLPSIDMTLLVPAPVGPPDQPAERRPVRIARRVAGSPPWIRNREAVRAGLGGVGQAIAAR